MNKGERGLPGPLDEKWFNEAIAVSRVRAMKGKNSSTFYKHTSDKTAKTVGVLENLRFEDHFLVGDVTIDDPEVAAKVESGELSEWSIEFNYQNRYIAGVAILEKGKEGHFSEEMLEYEYEGIDEGKTILTSLMYKPVLMDTKMTKEEIQLMIDTAVKNAFEAGSTQKLSYDPVQERELIKAEVKAEVEKPVVQKLTELEMELAFTKLKQAGVPFTSNQVKRKLAEFSTKGEKDLWVELQIEKFAKGTFKTEVDAEDMTPETYLSKEFDTQGGVEKLGFSKQEYVEMHLESTKSIWSEIKKDLK